MSILESTAAATGDLAPKRSDKFSFGLWTVGWVASDPFGVATRPALDVVEAVERLAELGAYRLTFHYDELFPFGIAAPPRRPALSRSLRAPRAPHAPPYAAHRAADCADWTAGTTRIASTASSPTPVLTVRVDSLLRGVRQRPWRVGAPPRLAPSRRS